MKTESRQILVYEFVRSQREVQVATLSEYFSVSPMTIRRDLDSLEDLGLIKRQYGKAVIINENMGEISFLSRHQTNQTLKHKIALTAIKHLKNASSIYTDGSSTAYEFISSLPPSRQLTVFTNSTAVLQYLQNRPNITIFIIGGFLTKNTSTLDSEISINIAKSIFVDATIISCSGFTTQGLFNNGITGSQVKRIMLENSHHNYLLADHTKFNTKGIFLLNTWDKIDTLICDQEFDPKATKQIQDQGVEVVTS